MGKFHQGIDWAYGFIYNDATNTGGKDTYLQAVSLVGATGVAIGTAGNPLVTSGSSAPAALTATTDRSGTATTTSGGLNVAANAARTFLVGQNVSAVTIGFNEQGGTAVIGSPTTYTVAAGTSFSASTNKQINFIAASGTAAVTMTEG